MSCQESKVASSMWVAYLAMFHKDGAELEMPHSELDTVLVTKRGVFLVGSLRFISPILL